MYFPKTVGRLRLLTEVEKMQWNTTYQYGVYVEDPSEKLVEVASRRSCSGGYYDEDDNYDPNCDGDHIGEYHVADREDYLISMPYTYYIFTFNPKYIREQGYLNLQRITWSLLSEDNVDQLMAWFPMPNVHGGDSLCSPSKKPTAQTLKEEDIAECYSMLWASNWNADNGYFGSAFTNFVTNRAVDIGFNNDEMEFEDQILPMFKSWSRTDVMSAPHSSAGFQLKTLLKDPTVSTTQPSESKVLYLGEGGVVESCDSPAELPTKLQV
jgi:hypothetical protein